MPVITVRIDAQDRRRVHSVAHVAWERSGTSAREIFRRMIYHADTWPSILPELKVPPAIGERSNFAVGLSDLEYQKLHQLADKADLSISDLGRALIYYHWQLRQNYFRLFPSRNYGGSGQLSFAPDRRQPWFDLEIENKRKYVFSPGQSREYILEWVGQHGVGEEDLEELDWRLSEAAGITEAYRWSRPYLSPAAMAKSEVENLDQRRRGFVALGDYWQKGAGVPWGVVVLAVLGLVAIVAMVVLFLIR